MAALMSLPAEVQQQIISYLYDDQDLQDSVAIFDVCRDLRGQAAYFIFKQPFRFEIRQRVAMVQTGGPIKLFAIRTLKGKEDGKPNPHPQELVNHWEVSIKMADARNGFGDNNVAHRWTTLIRGALTFCGNENHTFPSVWQFLATLPTRRFINLETLTIHIADFDRFFQANFPTSSLDTDVGTTIIRYAADFPSGDMAPTFTVDKLSSIMRMVLVEVILKLKHLAQTMKVTGVDAETA